VREPYKLLDLFSGIGGFSLGLERTGGFKTVAFCERDPFCQKVIAKHWPGVEVFDDVETANFEHLGPVDLVVAGFPCQDVSLAGTGAGLSGERSGLFWHILRAVRMVGQPKLLLENVAELLDRGMGAVLGALAQVGYDTQWHCIPASAVGLAQERDRCWIIADPMQDRATRLLTSTDISANGQGRASGEAYLQHIASAPFEQGNCHPQPLLRGMARRVPNRVDRVGAVGNSVAPQIPERIGRAILAADAAA
jgi:DNA (cytosine-5)-methyltransferase 1